MRLKTAFYTFSILLMGVSAHLFAQETKYPSIQDLIDTNKVVIKEDGECKSKLCKAP